jgi:cytochrome c
MSSTPAGDGEAAEEPAEAVDFATVFAAADAGAGERLWRQCQACHGSTGRTAPVRT